MVLIETTYQLLALFKLSANNIGEEGFLVKRGVTKKMKKIHLPALCCQDPLILCRFSKRDNVAESFGDVGMRLKHFGPGSQGAL